MPDYPRSTLGISRTENTDQALNRSRTLLDGFAARVKKTMWSAEGITRTERKPRVKMGKAGGNCGRGRRPDNVGGSPRAVSSYTGQIQAGQFILPNQ